jgi:alpha-beta hydrolase superfamily lysophospholipase
MIHDLRTVRGTDILYRKWEVPDPKAFFIFVHGLGAHSGRWEFLANYVTQSGYSSYGIELKGFGFTPQEKGFIRSLSVYEKDICLLRDEVTGKDPGKKIFLLGESMGGLISFFTVLRNKEKFDGLICLSPAFQSKLRFSSLEYLKIAVAAFFKPRRQFKLPFTKEMCTRDIAYQAFIEGHNAEHRTGTARLLFELGRAQLYCFAHRSKFDSNALFLLAGKDQLVNNETSKKIFNGVKTADNKLIVYPEMYHALSIDMGRNDVFRDIINWTEKILLS